MAAGIGPMWPVTWPTEANENTRVARGMLSAITVGSSNLCTGPKFWAAAPNIVADQNFSVVLDLIISALHGMGAQLIITQDKRRSADELCTAIDCLFCRSSTHLNNVLLLQSSTGRCPTGFRAWARIQVSWEFGFIMWARKWAARGALEGGD